MGIREVSVRVGESGCSNCYLKINIYNPKGDVCHFYTDGRNYDGSHPDNSVITLTGSQLDTCDGWTGDSSISPTEDGWRIRIWYHASSDTMRLNDGHVYFSTNVDTRHGLYCP